MSLLMKALEKAAKDRQDGATAAGGAPELALEPIAPAAGAPSTPPPTAPGSASRPAAPDVSQAQMRAANVMNTGRAASRPGPGAFLINRPVYGIAALAAIFLAGFGVYVYLEINHPALLRDPFGSMKSVATAPPVQQPPAAPPAQAAVTGIPSAPTAAPAAPSPLTPPALAPDIPASPVAATGTTSPPAAPPGTAPAAAAGTAAAGAGARPARAAEPEPAPPQAPSPERSSIRVSRGSTEPALSPALADAYQALEHGNFDTAQRLYNQVLRGDPRNIDALLGLAAIASQQGNNDTATRHYSRVLEVDPRNATAQAGLIAITGATDSLASESRLRALISREPSAFLYFTLGNLYADQSRWTQAQQAYFQAFTMEPTNPDYAYNLAVSLEHMNQPRPALAYYRQAVQLAQARGSVNFSVPAAQSRVGVIEKLGGTE